MMFSNDKNELSIHFMSSFSFPTFIINNKEPNFHISSVFVVIYASTSQVKQASYGIIS